MKSADSGVTGEGSGVDPLVAWGLVTHVARCDPLPIPPPPRGGAGGSASGWSGRCVVCELTSGVRSIR